MTSIKLIIGIVALALFFVGFDGINRTKTAIDETKQLKDSTLELVKGKTRAKADKNISNGNDREVEDV